MSGHSSAPLKLASLFLLAVPSAVWAQSNTLTIEQRGTDNQLTVDQSGASNSEVRGLEIEHYLQDYTYTVEVPVAFDEQGNATETQTSTISSTVQALNPISTPSALQSGLRNVGTIDVTGDGSIVGFLQRGSDNTANIAANGADAAFLGQQGDSNEAKLDVGLGATGTILQHGNDNEAELTVTAGATGSISQIGNGNTTLGFDVDGRGTSAMYVVRGNDVTSVSRAGVISNGAAVQIIQTPGAGF